MENQRVGLTRARSKQVVDTSLIKQKNGFAVVIEQLREAAGEVVVSIDGDHVAMPLDEWRALPVWDGAYPILKANDG